MQGFRTVVVALVSGVVTPWLADKTGLVLTEDQQTTLVGLVMAGVMVAMRVITKTPIFNKPSGDKNVP